MSEGVFIHLHGHSDYSIRDGCMKVEKYIEKVKDLGMSACAITEHGNLYSIVDFYKAGKKHGVKSILGVEAYVIPEKEMAESEDKKIARTKHHLVLLAKDEIGFQQISKAVSMSQLLKDRDFPRITYANMQELFVGGHIVCLSGCIGGEMARLILDNKYEKAREKACFYEELFGKGNYYLEVQDHGLEEQKVVRAGLIKLSRETNIPLVATNDCHYVKAEDKVIREITIASRFKTTIKQMRDERGVKELDEGEYRVKSAEEMIEMFKDIPEAITNTVKIANMCNVEFEKEYKHPKFKTPNGETEDTFLKRISYEGLNDRFPLFDTWEKEEKKTYIDRIEYELGIIADLKYSGYILIVQDFIKEGRRIGLVGPGRGSAVGSLVSYLIKITDVNPMDYDLIFERFLNKDRISEPDIDTDFCDMREDVIKYVKNKYGEKSVCNIITFGTLAARAVVRTVGRALGISLDICDRVAKSIPAKVGMTIDKALIESEELREAYENDKLIKNLIDKSKPMEGMITQTGVHAAGVIIADKDVSEYIPLVYDGKKDLWISQYDMTTCEDFFGLLKMDFLGLKNLTIIKRTLKNIEKNHGVKIDLNSIPLDDKDVIREIFARGFTKGVFQFESLGMVEFLRRFQPTNIEDLILLNAAYRPGPLQYLDEIVETKQGKKKPEYLNDKMKNILSLTYGKPIYQEQILKMFNEVAGFTYGEADIIRRAMSKKKLKDVEVALEKFEGNLIKSGADSVKVKQLSVELMDFARYAFNKSHAAAYAILAYQTAYLKHHYPVEYMANILTMASSKELPVYIKECKRMGISVLPPSVNESDAYFTPIKNNNTIRFGLTSVKGVKDAGFDIIKDREKNGLYKSIDDYVRRHITLKSRAVFKTTIENLILTGAFNEFGVNKRHLISAKSGLTLCDHIKTYKTYLTKLEDPKARDMTKANWKRKVDEYQYKSDAMDFVKSELLESELELMGFYASGHPLDEYTEIIQEKAEVDVGDINEELAGREFTVVGKINDFMNLYRKSDGAGMCKFTLQDLTGEIDCIVFTKAFAKHKKNIREGEIVSIRGKVLADIDEDNPEFTQIQLSLSEIEVLKKPAARRILVFANNIYELKTINSFIDHHLGNEELYVFVRDEREIKKAKRCVSPFIESELNTRFETLQF